jgi:hypothetical protein
MAETKGSGKGTKAGNLAEAQAKALDAAAKAGAGVAWIREDGAVCFGNDCAIIKPTESGKLGLTVRPDRCGEATGRILLDYLIKTAGKGVQIEIPSEIED